MVYDDCGFWPPRTPTPPLERIVHRVERFADATRKRGRRARNVVRRNASCILTYVDYLLVAIKWRLFASRARQPRNDSVFALKPICIFSFLERHDLESCQLVCKFWLQAVEENHERLALRMVGFFWLNQVTDRREKTIHHPSFRRYQHLTVECSLRDSIRFAAKSGQSVATEQLDNKLMRLCRWGALRHLRNAYVKELKLAQGIFLFSPLTAIKGAIGPRSSLSVGTLFLEEPPLHTRGVSRFLRDCRATFKWDTLRFDDGRRRNCNPLASAASCSTMVLHCPVGSVKYFIQLLKSAKCSSLTIEHGLIKANVIEVIETIRPLHPSQIPQDLCLAMDGHYGGFYSRELDPSFDLLNLKLTLAVSMTPVKDGEDGTSKDMHYRYLFSADSDGLALEATVGLWIQQPQNGLPDVFVRKFEYRFIRDVSNVRARANIGQIAPCRMPTELLVDILTNLSRKDVDSCQLVSIALNGRIMTLSSVLPLHPVDDARMVARKLRTSEITSYSLYFSYHFADSSIRDSRVFDKLETTDEARPTAKIHLAFAHFRNTYIREAFLPTAPCAVFFCRYFAADLNASVGTAHLNWRDQCQLALRFNSMELAIVNCEGIMGYFLGTLPQEKIRRVENRFVGNATFVSTLIVRFKQMEDTSMVLGSFTLPTEVFGVSEVFKPPADDVQVTFEPTFASDAPTTSSATCICHRRRIRNVHTGDELELCLIRPSKMCGVTTVNFRLVHSTPNV